MDESPQKADSSSTKEEEPSTNTVNELVDGAPTPFSAIVAIAALKNDSGAISELAWYKSPFIFIKIS